MDYRSFSPPGVTRLQFQPVPWSPLHPPAPNLLPSASALELLQLNTQFIHPDLLAAVRIHVRCLGTTATQLRAELESTKAELSSAQSQLELTQGS